MGMFFQWYTGEMKISAPRIATVLENGSLDDLLSGDLEDIRLSSIDATNQPVTSLEISSVMLEKMTLTATQFERINVRDLAAKQCDFSASMMAGGAINRATFTGCRMTGVDFNKTDLHDVTFTSCKLDMANFRFADLRRVAFIDCTLTETDFIGATMYDVSFQDCTLERTVFEQAKCKQVDLRGSQLSELIGWRSLKGAIIDDLQLVTAAPYLAHELGIIVK
jgi:uncharacterized protein YjbI with pentapeptide repeats